MIIAEQHGAPSRIGKWWDIRFWYRCTEHPEFGGVRQLAWMHLDNEHEQVLNKHLVAQRIEEELRAAEDKAVGLELQPDGRVFEVAK